MAASIDRERHSTMVLASEESVGLAPQVKRHIVDPQNIADSLS